MGFGGAAAAANAAIKRNAALRGGRKFLNAAKRSGTGNRAGLEQTASDAVRKRFNAELRASVSRDRTLLTTAYVLIAIVMASTLLWRFL
ncbi:hypothetical protein [Lewinella sp. IMCC34183]|uniref:hypothetical protein n=1 Tax=Lewinella sp. IMCC34183 TaxID=2248762 RepID=UPI001300AB22|nr:hypothetical protein [Lewinella sp. IMCC34183]